jgi:hypothetical protein
MAKSPVKQVQTVTLLHPQHLTTQLLTLMHVDEPHLCNLAELVLNEEATACLYLSVQLQVSQQCIATGKVLLHEERCDSQGSSVVVNV